MEFELIGISLVVMDWESGVVFLSVRLVLVLVVAVEKVGVVGETKRDLREDFMLITEKKLWMMKREE